MDKKEAAIEESLRLAKKGMRRLVVLSWVAIIGGTAAGPGFLLLAVFMLHLSERSLPGDRGVSGKKRAIP